MSEIETEIDDDVAVHEHDEAAASIVEQLRARRRELSLTNPYEILEVPGYDGALVVRVRYPDGGWKRVVKALEVAQNTRDDEAALNGNIDAILACTDTVLGRDPESGSYRDLRSNAVVDVREPVEQPLKFTTALAELLGIEVPHEVRGPGRFICRHVFSPRAEATGIFDGDVGLMTTGGRLLTWLQDTSKSASEAFAGG